MVALYRCGILAVIVWIIVGVYAWTTFALPEHGKVVGLAKRQTQFELPRPVNLRPDLAVLAQSDLWGRPNATTQVAGAAASQPAEVWARIAVVKEDKNAYVLLSSPKGEIKPFKVGDTLPDGSKLIKVSPEEVIVRPGSGKPQTFRLLN
ncbi:hypothetical protein IGB42_04130 [Andreprevotia sp. IGB-42]|uniref:hypothetical protein n=1 Tax=Andreprevotia sp. IGB-42 TaxID=2497473 RepID=UPI00135C2DD2|nr:hypothetical protein [Andreprevotia sp. IGB-42]KAF0811431.1 hypothetical protein IGB42_04130 [Andreprevotia sp. IGB-42]